MCECKPEIQVTPPPSGNTQKHVFVCGRRATRNGQVVTAPFATTTSGALKMKRDKVGVTGVYSLKVGDILSLEAGEWRVGVATRRIDGVNVIQPGPFGTGNQ